MRPVPWARAQSARRFFFSSRRRHTRFDCDWSSDVCSSGLPASPAPARTLAQLVPVEPATRPSIRILVADDERSEEHTSELQSQSNLVCRLLLEKKKNTRLNPNRTPNTNLLMVTSPLHINHV